MGFADYLSRNPNEAAKHPSEEDTLFIINQINDFKIILIQNTLLTNTSCANNQLSNF